MTKIKLNSLRKEVSKRHFLTPIENLIKLNKIGNSEDNNLSDTYRKIWLQQGRQDFDNPNISDCKLNSDELVELYCYYYLQMHYSSSLLVFNNAIKTLLELCNAKNSLHFIDIGCGPITSGIAFNHWLQDNIMHSKNIHYYGIDTSQSMCKKANELLLERNFVSEYISSTITIISESTFVLPTLIRTNIGLDEDTGFNSVIVINCCYLFASHSLDIPILSRQIKHILELAGSKHNVTPYKPKVVIIYQNPKGYRQKWIDFKQKMSTFSSVNNYPQEVPFSYKSATQSDREFNFNADIDIIKNF